jgi:hypothetical protein
VDGEEIDRVDHLEPDFPSATDAAHEGQSFMLDGALLLGPVGVRLLNDVGIHWFHTENLDFIFDESPIAPGEHNIGTPGQPNPPSGDAGP